MNITVAGTGNVAHLLTRKLLAAGHRVPQVYGRNAAAAAALAALAGSSCCSAWQDLSPETDVFLLALSDQALTEKVFRLPSAGKLVIHTAGAVPMNVLQGSSDCYGVLYPLQTISRHAPADLPMPLLVNGNTATACTLVTQLAGSLSPDVSVTSDADRLRYHLAAVLVNNFSNFLYVQASQWLGENGLSFERLLPLIDVTASHVHDSNPLLLQTGPAKRQDAVTIDKHLELLASNPELQSLYREFSRRISTYPWPEAGNAAHK